MSEAASGQHAREHAGGHVVVPLFPLPNVVLFPRAVLPLHIFEERYVAMTRSVLAGDRQVAMALLKPGWERDYYQAPQIESVVCIGKIMSVEHLPEGKFNFLLQGHTRARVVRELEQRPYRIAQVEPLHETPVLEIDLEEQRRQFEAIFTRGGWAQTTAGAQFQQLLSTPLATADIADMVAFTFLDDVRQKQDLLADPDVRRRVQRTLEALRAVQPLLKLTPDQPSMN